METIINIKTSESTKICHQNIWHFNNKLIYVLLKTQFINTFDC